MFQEILSFEIKNRLKQPMVYVFTLINFILVFVASVSDNIQIGEANDAIHMNSPHVIMTTTLLMTLIGVFMTTAFINTAILRDFNYKFDEILFSTSITKIGYLGGRFLSAFIVSLIPFIGVLLGFAVAGVSSIVSPEDVSPFSLSVYISVFFTAVVPNVFLISAVIFSLAAIFRSSLYSFIGAIGIVILYMIMLTVSSSLDNETIAILSDPLGVSSYGILTKYWTIEEKNAQIYGYTGLLMINRLLWTVLSFAVLLFTYFKFSFSRKSVSKRSKTDESKTKNHAPIYQQMDPLPTVTVSDSQGAQWNQYLHHMWMETKGLIRSTPFIVIIAFGIINMFGSLTMVDQSYGTGNHPVTYLMVDGIRNSLYIFLLAVLMYYSGVLIWKERDIKMDELYDASPMATWIPYMSKLSALVLVTAIVLVVGICCGSIVQLFGGYTNFEFGIYARELLVYDLLQFTIMIALSMFVQTLVNNKYLGYFIFLVSMILLRYVPSALEITSNMVVYGDVPSYMYSDMNGWSLYSGGLFWFNIYWMLFAGLLTVAGILFWVRGKENELGKRIKLVRGRFNGKLALSALIIGLAWIGTSSFLYYQTQVVNSTHSENEIIQERLEYELKYKKYQHIPQPRITDVDYEIEIYPEERQFSAKANMTIQNKTEKEISEIHFTLQEGYDITIEIDNATLLTNDEELNYLIYKLDSPMKPKAEKNIIIHSKYISEGIENEVSNENIVSNGSFINNYRFLPSIGYNPSVEISDANERKSHDLPEKPRVSKLHANCSSSCRNSYISQDSDWVHISSTIGTSSDQIGIAPGSLTKEWTEGNRTYFKYELDQKVLNFYSFISGKYEIARDTWTSPKGKIVNVEVYYHKGHEYNVDKMIKSLKNSLSYFTKNYTEYPHNEARIIEFPRYESFAQAFPGTMPYSESMGFISNLQEENAIDHVYYVVAHEMAHQWWAHQVIGANIQGATMLSESFAQYSALMVMKKEYGADKMKQFMRYEMDRYLRGRARENEKEMPLMFNENQPYIHYAKGSVVMYALQEYIGEDKINSALKAFAEDKAYQEPPYTNTLEFKDYLYEVTPDSLHYLIKDMVESITLYNNKTVDASYVKIDEDTYEVTLEVAVAKYIADSIGAETLVAHNDYIDIGVFSDEIPEGERYGRPIKIQRVKINQPTQTFKMIVNEKPSTAGIDPNYLLVDRMPDDNVKDLTER